jgi:hypothetical protein
VTAAPASPARRERLEDPDGYQLHFKRPTVPEGTKHTD